MLALVCLQSVRRHRPLQRALQQCRLKTEISVFVLLMRELLLIKSMCNSRRLTDPGPTAGEEVVFFDVLGVVMIVYTQQSAFYFNAATLLALVVLLLFSPATRNKRRLCYSIVGAALSFFAGVGACLAAAVVLTMAGQPMKWFVLHAEKKVNASKKKNKKKSETQVGSSP